VKNISEEERQKLFATAQAEDLKLFPREDKHFKVPVDASVDPSKVKVKYILKPSKGVSTVDKEEGSLLTFRVAAPYYLTKDFARIAKALTKKAEERKQEEEKTSSPIEVNTTKTESSDPSPNTQQKTPRKVASPSLSSRMSPERGEAQRQLSPVRIVVSPIKKQSLTSPTKKGHTTSRPETQIINLEEDEDFVEQQPS
jgi:hypothetical protein